MTHAVATRAVPWKDDDVIFSKVFCTKGNTGRPWVNSI